MPDRSTTAKQLADAALHIATANHYMVGFHPVQTFGISLADFQDAYQILIDVENKVLRRRMLSADTRRKYDLAFEVLAQECKRVHKYDLSR